MPILTSNIAKIKKAFPALPVEFYDILCEKIKEHNFTDHRLVKAVNHVIDSCIYPTPTIAQFITFDKDNENSVPKFNRGKGI
jgi:hypothetical protein